jgi:hypothetical protein
MELDARRCQALSSQPAAGCLANPTPRMSGSHLESVRAFWCVSRYLGHHAVAGFWAIMRSRGHDTTKEPKAGDAGPVSCLRFAYDFLRDAPVHHGKLRTYTDSTSGEQIRAKLA